MKDKKSGIFGSWLQNFAMLVFTQSFHAIFLVFVLKMMSVVSAQAAGASIIDKTTGILAVVSIAGSMALIKFEKIIKNLFGINDSKFMGDLAGNFAKSFGTVASGVRLAQRTAEPFKNYSENRKTRNRLTNEIRELNGQKPLDTKNRFLADLNNDLNYKKSSNSYDNSGAATPLPGGQDGSGTTPPPGNNQGNNGSTPPPSNNQQGDSGTGGNNGRISDLISALERNTNAVQNSAAATNNATANSKEDKLKDLQKQLELADAEAKVNARQMFTRTGSTLAAAGFGLGAADDFGNVVNVANLVDAPLDWGSDKIVKKEVYTRKSREIDEKIEKEKSKARERIKTENPSIDTTELEKAVERATENLTKGLKDAKITIDDKVPESLARNLANVWKDVQNDTTRRTIRTRNNGSSGRSGRTSVDDI